ncbi:hypothetical protein [uncultured Desulfobacter sp.]|uniref:hypothetical protein n=1 Tax=uncultured Desulfobacter sp. TaxID=240139 RepID=UPI002AAB75BE|nr:hypothetical protein [uncultured Desulfobacter sp.]
MDYPQSVFPVAGNDTDDQTFFYIKLFSCAGNGILFKTVKKEIKILFKGGRALDIENIHLGHHLLQGLPKFFADDFIRVLVVAFISQGKPFGNKIKSDFTAKGLYDFNGPFVAGRSCS